MTRNEILGRVRKTRFEDRLTKVVEKYFILY
jgi:hypothetical protein